MAITPGAEPGSRLYVAEPPVKYRSKPPAVVDASLIGAILFAEDNGAAATSRVALCQLHAPVLLGYELANVAMNKVRRGREPDEMTQSLSRLAELGVALYEVEPLRAFDLAVRYRLSAYDAAYLALADVLRCPILTFDQRLGAAAQQHLGSLE